MVDEKRKVAVALAERGDEDGHDVDAEVEVFTESALANGVFEVFVGGSDQTEIDFAGDAAAEPLNGAFLEDAQELALQVGIEGRDFVEKERAGVGRFNHTGLGGIGAGEGSLFVAEEFGLHQSFG